MHDRKYELGNERIGRLLIRYSSPAIFAMFVNSLYNVVDTIFVGRGAGTLALAGLAVSFPIQMIVLAIAQVVGIGSASVISRSLGAGDQRRAERTAGSSFAVVAVLSVLVSVFSLLFLSPLARLFGATADVLPYAREYLGVIMGFNFFFAFAVCTNNVVRSEGNLKLAMKSMLIGAFTNVILDPIFIFGFGLGIRGAAIATILANVCVFLFLTRYFVSGRSMLHIRRRDLMPYWGIMPEVFAIGSSSLVRLAAGSLMAIAVNNSIAHYGTNEHLAILGIANRVLLFVGMPMFGLVQGLQPIVGFNYGAENYRRVREAVSKAAIIATGVSIAGFAGLMLFPGAVFGLFTKDADLVREGSQIIRILAIMMPLIGFQIIGSSLFQALGKPIPAMALAMSRQILFLIPLVLVLPLFFSLAGIWAAFPCADMLSAFVTALWVGTEMRNLRLKACGSS